MNEKCRPNPPEPPPPRLYNGAGVRVDNKNAQKSNYLSVAFLFALLFVAFVIGATYAC